MPTAVFDLDGTLADTAPDLIAAANEAARNAGLSALLDPVADRAVAGRGGRAMLREARARSGASEDADAVETMVPGFLALYEARIAEETRLFEGAVPCLDALETAGWRLAICTNKPERLARLLLERLDVADRFRALIGADTLAAPKPCPETFREAVARAGGSAADAVMIGDTRTDMETARRAAAPGILCRFGYEDAPHVSLGADAMIDALADLPLVASALLRNRLTARRPRA